MLGSDGAAGEDAQAGGCSERGDGYEADVGSAGCQLVGALGGEHPFEFVAVGQFGCERWVFEVPHEGCGVQETDGGNAKPKVRS